MYLRRGVLVLCSVFNGVLVLYSVFKSVLVNFLILVLLILKSTCERPRARPRTCGARGQGEPGQVAPAAGLRRDDLRGVLQVPLDARPPGMFFAYCFSVFVFFSVLVFF